jgi:hypothetical protein
VNFVYLSLKTFGIDVASRTAARHLSQFSLRHSPFDLTEMVSGIAIGTNIFQKLCFGEISGLYKAVLGFNGP